MRILLYVEGDTEFRCLPSFLQKWLDSRIQHKVEIKAINFRGVTNYKKDFAQRARRALQGNFVLGIVGLIDYYGSGFATGDGSVEEKCSRAKAELEQQAGVAAFRQHFAVHETEAWLFSDPRIFDTTIQPALPTTQLPEIINNDNPPARRLDTIYQQRMGRHYSKTIDGKTLFDALDPEIAYNRCPHLKLLVNDVLALATSGR